jgi:hypothetical protein
VGLGSMDHRNGDFANRVGLHGHSPDRVYLVGNEAVRGCAPGLRRSRTDDHELRTEVTPFTQLPPAARYSGVSTAFLYKFTRLI